MRGQSALVHRLIDIPDVGSQFRVGAEVVVAEEGQIVAGSAVELLPDAHAHAEDVVQKETRPQDQDLNGDSVQKSYLLRPIL